MMDRLLARGGPAGRTARMAAMAVVLLAVVALPLLDIGNYWRSVLVQVLLFALLALGLNVVVGFAGLLDLGYIAFFAIGNYTFAMITAGEYSKGLFLRGGRDLPPIPEWNDWMWLLIVAAVVAAMVTGVVLGGPTLRLRGDYLAIVTLGFGEIVRIVARNMDSHTVGPRGITAIPHMEVNAGPVHYGFGTEPIGYYYVLVVLTVVMMAIVVRLNHSRIGRAWAAIREDEVAAATMGVPTVRMKLWAFAIGASTAGAAGAVQASQNGYVSPDSFVLMTSFLVLAMVVLGGMGSIIGSIVGAAVIMLVPEIARTVLDEFQTYRFLVFGAVLVLVMIFRPQGLVPSRRRAIELAGEVREGSVYEARAETGGGGPRDVAP